MSWKYRRGGHKGRMRAVLSIASILAMNLVLAVAPVSAQNSGTAQRQQALALEQQGKVPEAEAAWRQYLKTHPDNPEPYAQLGVLEARQGHYKEAVPLYRKALAMNPKVPALRLNLGLALFKDGQFKESIPEFTELLKTAQSGSADALRLNILTGMAHYGVAEYAQAIPYLKEAAAHDPSSLPLRLALAHSCLWSKQYQCVMDVYREILDLNAESAEADMLAGEALDEMKDNAGSTKMFRAAVAANPKEPNAHFGLGYLLWTQKQYPEAAAQFQAELANDPAHAQSMLYLGDTDLQLNKPEDARPLLEKAVALDPTLWLGDLDLGIIDSDAGRNDEALRELETAAKLKPDDVNVHWRLARLYRTMGRKDEAKAEFDKASKLNKAADDSLYQKISNGRKRAPDDQNGAPAGTPETGTPATPPNL
jgi:tetratricopeptide (TPR) repeat protein